MSKQIVPHQTEAPLPPSNLRAEQATLGAMLLSEQDALVGLQKLEAADFYREAHQQIFAAMKAVSAAGELVNLITVNAALKQDGVSENAGGAAYLMALMNEVGGAAETPGYANIVRDRSLRRRMIAFGADVQEKATDNSADAGALMAETVTGALGLADRSGSAKTAAVTTGWEQDNEMLHAAIDQPFGVTPARSGIPALDALTGGYGGMYLIVMMSEQKSGKTSFSVQTALASAEQFAKQDEDNPQRVLVIPLEEGRDSWVRMACCWLSWMDTMLSLPGRSHDRQKAKIHEQIDAGHGKLLNLPITIAEGVRTTDEVITAIQVEQHRGDLGLIVVDYLQRLSAGDKERESLTQTARALQQASEDTRTPLLLSSQMSWNDATNTPLTYGSRGATFDASLVMSIKRDTDADTKQKKDSGVIKCQWARSIKEFGEVPFWVNYSIGGHYLRPEEEHDEGQHGTRMRVERDNGGPPQDH